MRYVVAVLMLLGGCALDRTGLAPARGGRDAAALDASRDAPAAADGAPSDGVDGSTSSDGGGTATDAGGDSESPLPPDAGPPDGGPADAGPPDAGPPPGAGIGDGCTSYRDCADGLACFTGPSIPGGYCTRSCSSDTDCGAGGFCYRFPTGGLCGEACTTDDQCRRSEGYVCQTPPGSSRTVCVHDSWF